MHNDEIRLMQILKKPLHTYTLVMSHITTAHIRDMNNITIYVYKIISRITYLHAEIIDTYIPVLIEYMHTHSYVTIKDQI